MRNALLSPCTDEKTETWSSWMMCTRSAAHADEWCSCSLNQSSLPPKPTSLPHRFKKEKERCKGSEQLLVCPECCAETSSNPRPRKIRSRDQGMERPVVRKTLPPAASAETRFLLHFNFQLCCSLWIEMKALPAGAEYLTGRISSSDGNLVEEVLMCPFSRCRDWGTGRWNNLPALKMVR